MLKNIATILLISGMISLLQSCVPAIGTGVTVLGVHSIQRKDFKNNINDAKIATRIKFALLQKFHELYKKISIEVLYGRVLLTGHVASLAEISDAIDIIWSIDGVVEVINELQVSENSNYFDTKQYIIDTYITSAIKANLARDKRVTSLMYNVSTIDNVVYLFGLARTQAELEIAANICAKTKGVVKVKSHVIVVNELSNEV